MVHYNPLPRFPFDFHLVPWFPVLWLDRNLAGVARRYSVYVCCQFLPALTGSLIRCEGAGRTKSEKIKKKCVSQANIPPFAQTEGRSSFDHIFWKHPRAPLATSTSAESPSTHRADITYVLPYLQADERPCWCHLAPCTHT